MKRTRKLPPELSAELVQLRRLTNDSASSKATVQPAANSSDRRVAKTRPFGNEKALLTGRWLKVFDLCQFAKKHRLSIDWLIGGDLKGRLKMTQRCPSSTTPRRHHGANYSARAQLPTLVEILCQEFDDGGSTA